MPRYHFRGQLLSLMRGYSAPCERCSYYGGLVPRWVRERVYKGVDDIYGFEYNDAFYFHRARAATSDFEN